MSRFVAGTIGFDDKAQTVRTGAGGVSSMLNDRRNPMVFHSRPEATGRNWRTSRAIRAGFWIAVAACLMGAVTLRAESDYGVILGGDAHFDSDKIASAGQPERRWLSYPGARLCLNPAISSQAVTQTPADLAIDLGGYVGTQVIRLPKVVRVGMVDAAHADGVPERSATRSTTWYPYKLTFQATFANGVSLSGTDFFVNRDATLVRVLEARGAAGKLLDLEGTAAKNGQVTWDESSQTLVVRLDQGYYALRFVRLSEDALKAEPLVVKPSVKSGVWHVQLPLESGGASYGIGFGFATDRESSAAALARAKQAFDQPVGKSLAAAKSTMDQFLSRVPAPKHWGLDRVDAFGVTPQMHRQSYYMAWAFLYQSLIDVLPENPAFPYPQMSLGKGALWDGGERTSPATCGWESFLGIQWLAFVEPDIAWQAYEGIMTRVDERGRLGGESLPSRKAQTAWILFQQKADAKRLAAAYPAIKRYLLWREQNPRWIWGENKHNVADEKDMEFVVSWLFDIDYAAKIATVLGLKDEAAFWQSKTKPMVDNMGKWFFSDPKALHQFYFANSGAYVQSGRDEVRPAMVLSGLGIPNLPPTMVTRMMEWFRKIHKPKASADGFDYLKYPDNNFLAYGLMERNEPDGVEFIEAVLRDCIRGGEFAETLEGGAGAEPRTGGVKPSLFTAMNIIEFSWLLNGVRYDSGRPVQCPVPARGTVAH